MIPSFFFFSYKGKQRKREKEEAEEKEHRGGQKVAGRQRYAPRTPAGQGGGWADKRAPRTLSNNTTANYYYHHYYLLPTTTTPTGSSSSRGKQLLSWYDQRPRAPKSHANASREMRRCPPRAVYEPTARSPSFPSPPSSSSSPWFAEEELGTDGNVESFV